MVDLQACKGPNEAGPVQARVLFAGACYGVTKTAAKIHLNERPFLFTVSTPNQTKQVMHEVASSLCGLAPDLVLPLLALQAAFTCCRLAA